MEENKKPKNGFLGKVFASVANRVRHIKDELTEEVNELREDGADFLDKHGKGRIKVGAASAFKVSIVKIWVSAAARSAAAKAGTAAGTALKVGAATAPLAKFTIPIAFVGGFLFGPAVSKKLAGWLRINKANDNEKPEEPKAIDKPNDQPKLNP